jgi:hypothetical protein
MVSLHRAGRRRVWTFLTDEVIADRLRPTARAIHTPLAVLGGTRGTLIVDACTCYTRVTGVDGRSRSSCLAHYLESVVILRLLRVPGGTRC